MNKNPAMISIIQAKVISFVEFEKQNWMSTLIASISSTDLALFVEPYGKIDPIAMYETRRIGFSIRHKECLYEGIYCASKHLKDINLSFELADEESWALEVESLLC